MDSYRPTTKAERDRRLLHGAGAGVVAQVLNPAVRFALTPFVLALAVATALLALIVAVPGPTHRAWTARVRRRDRPLRPVTA